MKQPNYGKVTQIRFREISSNMGAGESRNAQGNDMPSYDTCYHGQQSRSSRTPVVYRNRRQPALLFCGAP